MRRGRRGQGREQIWGGALARKDPDFGLLGRPDAAEVNGDNVAPACRGQALPGKLRANQKLNTMKAIELNPKGACPCRGWLVSRCAIVIPMLAMAALALQNPKRTRDGVIC